MISLSASGSCCPLKETMGRAEMQTQMLLQAAEMRGIAAENVQKCDQKDMITISYSPLGQVYFMHKNGYL